MSRRVGGDDINDINENKDRNRRRQSDTTGLSGESEWTTTARWTS